ncbi:MAG: agmatine deiminase family protein [Bacteroidales bacterium]|nr:agmatine deiminase family protein [Bacteroidales bacterium]
MSMNRTGLMLMILFCGLVVSAQRRMVAEWEPAFGTLIRWPLGIPGDLVVELARHDSVYVLVENPGQQAQATATFQSYGVNMNHCRFLEADTYSHWTRDWGPHYVFDENGNAGIADPLFDGYPWVPGCNGNQSLTSPESILGYEEDDAVNAALAGAFGLPLIEFPAYLTGGNIMTDGQGLAYSTQQMLDESETFCNQTCFMANAAGLLGLTDYSIASNPEVYGIQHIDCYAKLLDEETVLVKKLPAGHPEYECVEDLANFFRDQTTCYGRNYTVHRIFCPVITGDEVPAYTNSLILNHKVLVPLFGIEEDEQALQTYRDLMPGYQVVGFTGSWYYYDALHCRTMGIFDPEMLYIRHKAPKLAAAGVSCRLAARVTDYSQSGLMGDSLFLYWKPEGLFPWNRELLTVLPGTDSLVAWVPGLADGAGIRYYFSLADSSGRYETLPRTAPASHFSLEFTDLLTGIPEQGTTDELLIYTQPFSSQLSFRYTPRSEGMVTAKLLDISGRTLRETRKPANGKELLDFVWETSGLGRGCYFLRITSGNRILSTKVIKQ